MNGFIVVCGVLSLTSGTDPLAQSRVGETTQPGSSGTVLQLPANTRWTFEQVATPLGPRVRLIYGRRSVEAPVVRWSQDGVTYTMWIGKNGPSVYMTPPPVPSQ